MSPSNLREALRTWITRSGRGRSRITLQHLGLADADLVSLRAVLEQLNGQLPLRLELHHSSGDVVLVEREFAERIGPQVLLAFSEERPVISIDSPGAESDPSVSMLQRFESLQQELLQQLRTLAVLGADGMHARAGRALAQLAPASADGSARPDSGFDPYFDSKIDPPALAAGELDEARRRVLEQLLIGLRDPRAAPLCLGYGPNAHLQVDFATGIVSTDALAQQQLRQSRELPLPTPGAVLTDSASRRTLRETLWDMGLASARLALLDAPADWWHAALVGHGMESVARYTRAPRHLDLSRRLLEGPATPAELRRVARVSVSELRAFLQACLFLGLLRWRQPGR